MEELVIPPETGFARLRKALLISVPRQALLQLKDAEVLAAIAHVAAAGEAS